MPFDDRIFDDQRGAATAFVATDAGLVAVSVAGDRTGVFSLAATGPTRDVTAHGEGLAVATDDDVRLGDGEDLEDTGFGPATAVGGDPLIAAGPDGRIGQWTGETWADRGRIDVEVRAVDGDLLATDAGVYRVSDDGVEHVGLEDARDVATAGVPHAATATGLYRLGAGWMDVLDGEFRAVAVDRATAEPGRIGRAHAATGEAFYGHDGEAWRERERPTDDPVVDVAYGPHLYAITASGTVLVDAGDGVRTRSLGVGGASALAVPGRG
ncbi:MAG: hypothetical protein ABEJ76_04925 [Halanaeroarchaeum sp.]